MTEFRLAYTIRHAARGLGVSEWTIRRWIRNETLPAIKVGGTWLIPADALDELLHPVPTKQTLRSRP